MRQYVSAYKTLAARNRLEYVDAARPQADPRSKFHALGRMNGMTRIAFMGFGEAAQSVARGLSKEAGVEGMAAYDPRFVPRKPRS